MRLHAGIIFVLIGLLGAAPLSVSAQSACASGCERNGDLVADLPSDPAQWRDPATLVWAYAPIEDPAVYATLFKPFTAHLAACLDRQIVYYPVQSSAAEVAAMRAGRLHFAGFSTGSTVDAVTNAGAVPFAAKGIDGEMRGYNLIAVVRANSPYQSLPELKGKRIAHSAPDSNSGNFAPRSLFPAEGLTPDQDYTPLMSGGHDRSILGVLAGDYDMAAIASDVLDRMVERGMVNPADLRIIYTSPVFPTSSFAYSHTLAPELVSELQRCFFNFKFPPEMQSAFNGDEQFVPIRYEKSWAIVRDVIERVTTAN